jgi:hypothetical protein
MNEKNKVSKILFREKITCPASIKDVLIDKNFYQDYELNNGMHLYTSYDNHKNTIEEQKFERNCAKFYANIITDLMREYHLCKSSQFSFHFWWQIYTNQTDCHYDHTHYNPKDSVLFSFVHFINVDSKDPCFHFLNENGTEDYINENSEDFILFGSWCRHRVKKTKTTQTRAIIAGNISIDQHIMSRQYF